MTRESRPSSTTEAAEISSPASNTIIARLPDRGAEWRYANVDTSPIGQFGVTAEWRQLRPSCPAEHARRLAAVSGLEPCPDHDCPLCYERFGGYCYGCEVQAITVAEAEGPVADPYCAWHGGVLTAATRSRDCPSCTAAWSRAKRQGWKARTGHDGVDCLHCWVCGRCKGSGKVCGDCWTCAEHTYDLEDPTSPHERCVGYIWSRSRRREVPFHAPRLYDPATGRWAA